MAMFLREGRAGAGTPPYASTQTGLFDLYLPFIEKGISLLNPAGRLGYIAPSLWTTNEYGEGLRKLIAAARNLDRWIDFKAYQVFEESTTYTALQFFTKSPNGAIRVAEAPAGEIPSDPWADAGRALPYGREAFGERWLLLTGEERALIDRLYQRCKRLDDPNHTSNIFVGIQTSADAIYHLTRKGPGRYLCTPRGENAPPPYEVELEDALMKPIVRCRSEAIHHSCNGDSPSLSVSDGRERREAHQQSHNAIDLSEGMGISSQLRNRSPKKGEQ
jgi:Eco57I restriction-modification methylase